MVEHDHHKINSAEQGVHRPTMQNDANPMRIFDDEKVQAYDQTNMSFEDIVEDDYATPTSTQPHRGLNARHIQMISLGGCIG
jgi:amino acid permease